MRLHLIDGTYELFRAHFSPRPSRHDDAGNDVKAIHGLAASLLALLDDEDEAVTHAAIAFDRPIESFRNRLFAGYKDSSDVDPALLAQLEIAEGISRSLGFTVWTMDEYEADDALASAAIRHGQEFDQVRILTPDKDLGQVVSDQRIVQVDRMRGKTYDAAGVRQRLGVDPGAVPDLLALVGDTADGIPGLAGFGMKTAGSLLDRYGRIDAIPTDAADWPCGIRGAARLATTLRERHDDVRLYRQLATLVTDLDLRTTSADLAYRGADRQQWPAACDRHGLGSLAQRPSRWA